ncbi:Polysaccharide monooxygenase Cel61a [Cyphellophora attinorum]|uniref:Polysaccharide monooxygenase Cel61a n=1 Tax=Cyphellophora attinorum TaxID=1664694 RepID=A0A0N1H0B1_9EURO|nr:Polysaccharide monooxygenase Cel61a [Phialophora attinorum]KPI37097.1 Polysaccharide monooxygenase Cel61a [Phialophora attinorum]
MHSPRSLLTSTLLLASLTLPASAHGTVQGIVANGQWYRGYSPQFQWMNPIPVVAGWSVPKDTDNGFVNDYTSTDIVCHREATPGGAYVKVAAGSTVQLLWTAWPHNVGPVLTYLSPCPNNDCATLDKSTALWTKIDQMGMTSTQPFPGIWGSSQLMQNNNSWTVTIPASVAPGKYVLRHEIIALHQSQDIGGAQNYPQCVNLDVSGSGTNDLSVGGTLGTKLYTANDPGIHVNVYNGLQSYVIPGPPVMGGGGGGAGGQSSVPSVPTSTTSLGGRPPTTLATVAAQQTLGPSRTSSSSALGIKSSCVAAPSKAVLFSGSMDGAAGVPVKFKCYADEL